MPPPKRESEEEDSDDQEDLEDEDLEDRVISHDGKVLITIIVVVPEVNRLKS